MSGPPPGPTSGAPGSIPPPPQGAYGPSPYPPGYYPPPLPRKRQNLALIVVIVVVVVVLVPIVLAAVLYIMTSTLVQPPNSPRVMAVSIGSSGDGSNWTLLITSTPAGLGTSMASLEIWTPAGSTALSPTPFASLTSASWSTNYAQFVGTGSPTVMVGDGLVISKTRYPGGYFVKIADSQGILYAHALG